MYRTGFEDGGGSDAMSVIGRCLFLGALIGGTSGKKSSCKIEFEVG